MEKTRFRNGVLSINYTLEQASQAIAQLNFPHRIFTFGFYSPGPACVPSHTSEKTLELMGWGVMTTVEDLGNNVNGFTCSPHKI